MSDFVEVDLLHGYSLFVIAVYQIEKVSLVGSSQQYVQNKAVTL